MVVIPPLPNRYKPLETGPCRTSKSTGGGSRVSGDLWVAISFRIPPPWGDVIEHSEATKAYWAQFDLLELSVGIL